MKYIITKEGAVNASLTCRCGEADLVCHHVEDDHWFFNPPSHHYYDIVNNHPSLPTLREWTQEEINLIDLDPEHT